VSDSSTSHNESLDGQIVTAHGIQKMMWCKFDVSIDEQKNLDNSSNMYMAELETANVQQPSKAL
jgi:hypothetical protein